jgi:hypothetical protein
MKLVVLTALLLLTIILAGCISKKIISNPTTLEVTLPIYDNNKNIAYINASSVNDGIYYIQQWINENPDKRIISVSSDSSGFSGLQTGWLIIYEVK